jgi:hypothetical protein
LLIGFELKEVRIVDMNISDQLKSQIKKLTMPIEGKLAGINIFLQYVNKEKPSIKACSSSSFGIFFMKLVKSQTLSGILNTE